MALSDHQNGPTIVEETFINDREAFDTAWEAHMLTLFPDDGHELIVLVREIQDIQEKRTAQLQ